MAHHQMDLYECIAVATTGSDGKPPVHHEREVVNINERIACETAELVVDRATEYVEGVLGLELTEEQYEQVTLALKADFAEAITEAFGDL